MDEEIKLFITFLIVSIFFVRWYGWNEESNFALVRAIVDERRFEIDSFANQTGDRAIYNNSYYSDKDPGLAFLTSPIYSGWKFLYNLFPQNFRENYSGGSGYISQVLNGTSVIAIVDRGFFLFTAMALITILTSGIFTALTALLIFKISDHFLLKKRDKIFLALTYFFGTIAFHYSLHFMNHASSAFFLFLSFFLLLKMERRDKEIKNPMLAGIFFGFSIVLDKLLLLFLPLFLAYSLFLDKKFSIIFLIFAMISILPYILYNYSIFGNPFEFTSTYIDREIYKHAYPLKVSPPKTEIIKASFFDIESLIQRLHLESIKPKPMVMMRLLFYPYRGLLFYSPILILSLIGIYFMWMSHKGKVIMIIIMLLSLLSTISMRTVWWGGYAFGARYLLPIVPFLMLPLTYPLKKFGMRIFLPFLLISIFINFLGLQPAEEVVYDWERRDIRGDWLEKQNTFQVIYNPITEHYLPLFLKYGPRSAIFEHLINGYISIDIRTYPLARGTFFPFSKFHVPFLCLVPLVLILIFIWHEELSEKLPWKKP